MRIVRKKTVGAGAVRGYSAPMSASGPKRDYEATLRDAGLRITKPRRIILQILGETDGHPDAARIFQKAAAMDSRISLATVYRTMRALEDSGAIQRHAFGDGPARFENAGEDHHDHLIDMETGQVIEFSDPRIEALQEEIARRLGYELVHHRLELYGRRIRARR
jgi:Fur family ferric uptake transcriptional regulator